MVRLKHWSGVVICLDFLAGFTAAILGKTLPVIFSVVLLFLLLPWQPGIRHHEIMPLFVFSTVMCFPINLHLSFVFASTVYGGSGILLYEIGIGILAAVCLSSVEEILLCLVGNLIWGRQQEP